LCTAVRAAEVGVRAVDRLRPADRRAAL
jgi:hypothetical protein